MTADCPDPAVLDQYLSDTLPADKAAELVAHVDTCIKCQSAMDALTAPADLPVKATGPLSTEIHPSFLRRLRGQAATPSGRFDESSDGLKIELTADKRGPDLPRPTRIGAFEILDEVGRGGMGIVYKARQTGLKRLVALKMIRGAGAIGLEERIRFKIEAEAVAQLQHPNIVQIFEVGEHEGRPYLVFEFMEGGSLDRLSGTTLPATEVAELVETLARAIHFAHSHGVIHRDMKPANILLQKRSTESEEPRAKSEERRAESKKLRKKSEEPRGASKEPRKESDEQQAKGAPATDAAAPLSSLGSSLSAPRSPLSALRSPLFAPKITDFGLAKRLGGDVFETQEGAVIGTPAYMAPEQATGSGSAIRPAIDIYALGVILYEFLTGRVPFLGKDSFETLALVCSPEPAPPPRRIKPDIPRDLETICLKCLEKEPARRYATAQDLADDLRRYRAGEPIVARPVNTLERLWKWSRRRPGLAGSLAVIGLLILSIAIGSAIAAARFQRIAHEKGELADQREAERDKALRAQVQERWERYRANIMTAVGALELNNNNIAQLALEVAPVEHRNWEWHYLESQLDRSSAVLPGHPPGGIVRDIPSSPDGKQVVLFDAQSRRLRLWDVVAGKEIAAVPHATEATVLVARPDGRQIAVGSRDGSLRLWDAQTNRPPIELPPHPSGVEMVAYSPDGRRLLSHDPQSLSHWFDTTTGQQLAPLGDMQAPCLAARFTPDSRRLVAGHGREIWLWDTTTGRKVAVLGSHDREVDRLLLNSTGSRAASQCLLESDLHLWDVTAGKRVEVLRGHTARLNSMAFSPDGARLATGGTFPDTTVRLWDAVTGKSLAVLSGHKNSVPHLQFCSDGRRLASLSLDNTVRLWDGLTGQPIATLGGHTGTINHFTFSADGTRLVTAAMDRTLREWNAETAELIAILRGHTGSVHDLTFAAGDKFLVSAAGDQTYRVWDLGLVERTGILRGHTSFVYEVAFRPDGGQVASAAWDGTLRLWNPVTGRPDVRLQHGDNFVGALAYRPDGKQLATITFDNQLHLWDVGAGKETHTIPLGNPEFWRVPRRPAFNREGTLLAAPTGTGRIGLWDPVTARSRGELQPVTAPHAQVRTNDLAFCPDGTLLAAGADDGRIRVWDVERRVEVATLSGHSQPVYRLAFSPDGSLLASGALDQTVRLWDIRSFREVAVLPCDSNAYGLAFTPDGTRLAVGCADNTIRLWDVARRQQVAELRGHNAYVHAIAFSPDGTQLVSASGDWTVRIWDSLKPAERSRRGQK